MGETENKLRALVHDIKNSWYFRVWVLLWLVCALTVFSGFIILSKQSAQTYQEKDVQFWVENATTINFPRFHFHTWGTNQTISNLTCLWNGQLLAPKTCPNYGPFGTNSSYCQSIYADAVYATNNLTYTTNYSVDRIYCNLTTTGLGFQNNTMVTWEIEDTISTGDNTAFNPFNPLFIAPSSFAWIMLEKSVYTGSDGTLTFWDKSLLYHTTIFTPGQYDIVLVIGSFNVWHIEQTDIYSGMMSTGEVGGFAFFTLILHTLVMIIVGMCLDNNSTFLKGKSE